MYLDIVNLQGMKSRLSEEHITKGNHLRAEQKFLFVPPTLMSLIIFLRLLEKKIGGPWKNLKEEKSKTRRT